MSAPETYLDILRLLLAHDPKDRRTGYANLENYPEIYAEAEHFGLAMVAIRLCVVESNEATMMWRLAHLDDLVTDANLVLSLAAVAPLEALPFAPTGPAAEFIQNIYATLPDGADSYTYRPERCAVEQKRSWLFVEQARCFLDIQPTSEGLPPLASCGFPVADLEALATTAVAQCLVGPKARRPALLHALCGLQACCPEMRPRVLEPLFEAESAFDTSEQAVLARLKRA